MLRAVLLTVKYAEYKNFFNVMMTGFMLNVIMLSVIMLNAVDPL
jgi:hypothetical protein